MFLYVPRTYGMMSILSASICMCKVEYNRNSIMILYIIANEVILELTLCKQKTINTYELSSFMILLTVLMPTWIDMTFHLM